MAQVINTNVQSLNAQRNLNNSAVSLATSLQRLSSGLRINSAKDDAAGLAISERFSTQIRGLNVAVRNANDGISLSQTAEGALGEISSNLQRIRELAVQARNATNSASDRAALNAEVQQRLAEIDRTASQTSFNGQKILDGSFGNATFQVGSNAGETIGLSLATSTRLADVGKIATATSNALGATATGGSVQIQSSNLNFGTAGTADGSLELNPSNRLFGPTGEVTITTDGTTNFNNTFNGSNTQAIPNTLNFGGANLAQFDISDGTTTVGITLAQNYANQAAFEADVQAQLDTAFGAGVVTVDSTTNAGFLTFENTAGNAAIAITNTDARAQAVGFVNSAGAAGGTGAQFEIDGFAINLNADYTDNAGVLAEIQSQLNTASPGTYTVTSGGGNNFVISNNNAGSSAVVISDAGLGSIDTGIVNEVGVIGTSTAATEATFTVGDGTNTVNVTLDQNYTSFGDDGDATSLLADLQTQLGANFTASFEAGELTISSALGDPVTISAANANATASGFGNQAGVVTTNASFQVDGNTINLNSNYASQAALATAIQSQLNTAVPSGYTVAQNAGVITITNNTLGSAAVTITNADANAVAAGIVNEVGTAGVGAGTVTLASGALTLKGATGDAVDFAGSYTTAQGLADSINSKLSGVFASITTDGKLKLQSAQEFTVGGTQAAALGLTVGTDPVDNGSLASVNVLTTSAADEAITRIDSALQSISSLRSDFGAIQNRFESTIANLQGTAENLSASRSRILDADFAAETANLTRAQILQQAGVAILSQANQLPQNVLSLLR